jgi:glycosyltransferase involved in cell wall biosynthesis
MKAIHQFLAGFTLGDAISNEALVIRGIFRDWGFRSDIFSEPRRILPDLRDEARDVASYRAECQLEDIVLLHLSVGSDVNTLFADLPCRKAILYHNITPSEYFKGIQDQIAGLLEQGRRQMKALAGKASVVMADSSFNAHELQDMGYGAVPVLPLVLDLHRLRAHANRYTLDKYGDNLVNVLFVGRCAPNKRLEDCLNAFYYFQKYVEPNSRFIHVGSFAGTEQYHALLLTMIRDMRLKNVDLVGATRQDELNAAYRMSRLFLCMSEHEGFCIPLIEAMVHDVPVLAYEAAAVPETLDGAGILFLEKRFDLIAEMMGRLVRDPALRHAVIQGQRERLARYEKRDLAAKLRQYLAPLMKNG